MIKGSIIDLVPAALDDRPKVYEWCFHSETTKYHIGPPAYPDTHIPTFEEFCDDYVDYFFTGAKPNSGRGFIITHSKEPIGFVSYCSYHLKPHKSELDIWMNSEANCGKGFGTDALIALGDYLGQVLGITQLIMRPSVKNINAIRSYKKTGFKESNAPACDYLLEEYIPLYGDGDYGADETVLLIKQLLATNGGTNEQN
ncbi:MAG: GNAT family N-acetyltransferase [Defluviitaleaceae bacterium]|nr:GNAT family N-acetyltransferase [Defluviitaleaceae bacterium]